jgi:hypothetical protein
LSVPSKTPLPAARTREVVAVYSDRARFEAAVSALLAAGFDRTDLSVLASHDSLEVAGDIAGYHREDGKELVSALGQQLSWLEPLTIAGVVFAAAGPIGAAVAALIAAAAGITTLRPLLAEVTENAHAAGFEDAVRAGHILLWVRTDNPDKVTAAEAILKQTGGTGTARLATLQREDGASA